MTITAAGSKSIQLETIDRKGKRMPWITKKQTRWGNSPSGKEAMGTAKVAEFNAASKGLKLPESKKPARAGKRMFKAK